LLKTIRSILGLFAFYAMQSNVHNNSIKTTKDESMTKRFGWIVLTALSTGMLWSPMSNAEQIGEVSTVFRVLGKNDRIVVEAYDDPKVKGVTCYVSRARTGGITGTLGLAEDKSDASIACRQVGDGVTFLEKLPAQEDVFTERLSIMFKRLHVVRVIDPVRNALVYMTYSDRLIEGSPQNSVTAVAIPRSTLIPVK
jgi:CreA protein